MRKKKKQIKYTTIRLHKSTYNQLKKYKSKSESFNKLINNIIKSKTKTNRK